MQTGGQISLYRVFVELLSLCMMQLQTLQLVKVTLRPQKKNWMANTQ